MSVPNDIILFHYPFSPNARRIVWYLTLRGIPYAQCLVPLRLPREDINALGVKYRRIPILAIGRDIYCDGRLILQKLESRFSTNPLSSSSPSEKAIEQLLQNWIVDGGVSMRFAQLIPPELPLLKDPKFVADREELTGRRWDVEAIREGRSDAVVTVRACFEFLEEGLLADGRKWIAGTEEVGMADIVSVWPFKGIMDIPGALPASHFSPEIYPKVYAWISRFTSACESAGLLAPEVVTLEGAEAVKHITSAYFSEQEVQVDQDDPLELKMGQDVEIWPTDTGSSHRDRGRLVGLTSSEVVLEAQSKVGEKVVRIHAPRHGFKVQAVGGDGAKI